MLIWPVMDTSFPRWSYCTVLFVTALGISSLAAKPEKKETSLADAAAHAIELSQIRVPGATPFHLKATLLESTNPDSPYTAEIEEYWVSPQKWRRTVTSEKFSQTVIKTGTQQIEQNTGDYYPLWLRNMVTALVDPIPMLVELEQSNAYLRIDAYPDAGQLEQCAHLEAKVGGWAAQNTVYNVICFNARREFLTSVVTPSYSAQFEDYRRFGNKLVPRKIIDDPEPGTTLLLRVTELTALNEVVDEKLFTADGVVPTALLRSLKIDQVVANGLALNTPSIQWPTVRNRKTQGTLSIYISADTSGRVREAWPLNSANAGLDDAVRNQVKNWRFKPVAVEGVPVQIETILTFAFDTKVANPIPLLTNEEARALAMNVVEAEGLPPGATATLRVSVDEKGNIIGVANPHELGNELFGPAYGALSQWRFRPYVRDGKPDRFDANITFVGPRSVT